MGDGSLLPSTFFSYYLKFYLLLSCYTFKTRATRHGQSSATSRKKACKKVYASKMKSLRISKEACTALHLSKSGLITIIISKHPLILFLPFNDSEVPSY